MGLLGEESLRRMKRVSPGRQPVYAPPLTPPFCRGSGPNRHKADYNSSQEAGRALLVPHLQGSRLSLKKRKTDRGLEGRKDLKELLLMTRFCSIMGI